MSSDHTFIVVLVDCSGSMAPLEGDTTGALNGFIERQAKEPGAATFSLYTFSSKEYGRAGPRLRDTVETFYKAMPIEMVQPIGPGKLPIGGGTPLFDALGQVIAETGAKLAEMPAMIRPGKVVFVVITDGAENDSRKFNKAQILEVIEHQKSKYSWQFLYLGVGPEAFDEAGGIGIGHTQAMSWEPHRPGGVMRGMVAASNAISDYRSGNTTEAVYSAVDRVNNNSK